MKAGKLASKLPLSSPYKQQIIYQIASTSNIKSNKISISKYFIDYLPKTMQVIIVTGSDEFSMDVSNQEPILDIKQRIANLLGIPAASQTLAVLGLELIDGLDLEDYPIINEGTRIDLVFNPIDEATLNLEHSNSKFPIIIKFSSRSINIEIDITETVRSLKEKIHIIDGTPIKRMSLYTSGVEMEEEFRYLWEYGIQEYSEIIVCLKSMSRLKAEPPSRRLNLVVQTSTSLLNAASIPLDMKDSSTVDEVKQSLLGRRILPADDYIFIHKQRIMRDSCSLRWHGVENGDYLYVFKGTVSNGGCQKSVGY